MGPSLSPLKRGEGQRRQFGELHRPPIEFALLGDEIERDVGGLAGLQEADHRNERLRVLVTEVEIPLELGEQQVEAVAVRDEAAIEVAVGAEAYLTFGGHDEIAFREAQRVDTDFLAPRENADEVAAHGLSRHIAGEGGLIKLEENAGAKLQLAGGGIERNVQAVAAGVAGRDQQALGSAVRCRLQLRQLERGLPVALA